MIDTWIRGGTVIDGTGAPRVRADVAIHAGRIVAVGAVHEDARQTIDAESCVVAPGFVDLHTHYDAQLLWDGTASPSPLHGVTTVVGGNCGFGLAPVTPDGAGYLARLLARVEGISLEALEQALDWRWSSFASYLTRFEGRLAVNAGFLCGHSALRRAVMGGRATGSEASLSELEAMRRLLGASLAEGALGFSTSLSPTHHDGEGNPVPSRAASRAELVALAAETGRHPGTTLEGIVPGCLRGFSAEEIDLLSELSLVADRAINWNLLSIDARRPELHRSQLDAASVAAERGARIVALTLPCTPSVRLSFVSGAILDGLPGWREVLALPVGERLRALADSPTRSRLAAGAASPEAGVLRNLARWERLEIAETFAAANRGLAGRTVGEVAAERGAAPFDALLDVVIADQLRTGLVPPAPPDLDELRHERAQVWLDERTVLGGSDAGAHLDVMCAAVYPTHLLAHGVREHGLLSLEEAVHQLTDVPARLYGLERRGRIAPGWHGDLVVFDPDRVAPRGEETRADLPAGAPRLFAGADGIERVLVNGETIVERGVFASARPGRVLRSGLDTETVVARSARQTSGTPSDRS